MSYTQSLLAEGETIEMQSRQHWLALVLDARNAIGIWVITLLLFLASVIFKFTGDVSKYVGIIVLVLFLVGLVMFAYRYIEWINEAYIVTNRRILKVEGVLNKKSMDSSLEKINDLTLEENLLGRMLNYGDLEIDTASDVAIDRFHMLRDAKSFKKEMLEQKNALEQGDFYKPSPPLMANAAPSTPAATMAPPAPMAAPAPMPAAPTAAPAATADASAAGSPIAAVAATDADDASQQVTATLARLADLRDRGAISAEEYEGKKAELLGRL